MLTSFEEFAESFCKLLLEFWIPFAVALAVAIAGSFSAGARRTEALRRGRADLCMGTAAALFAVGTFALGESKPTIVATLLFVLAGIAVFIHAVIVARGARLLALGLGSLVLFLGMTGMLVVALGRFDL